jgi:aspartate/methionine/tyrosine aminotransferase
MRSAYMEWVKTQTAVKFNLANSGVRSYALPDLGVDFSGFELSGPGAYGYPPLRAAIAVKEGVSEACVTTALGTSGANWLAMAATLGPGDEVVMEHPAYPLMWETAEYLGATVKFFERRAEDKFAVDPDAVQRAMSAKTRLIVLTNLHNPTCTLISGPDLLKIGALAERTGARVLVDEVYLDLLGEQTPKSAFHLGPAFLSTNSLTKVYGLSGLRCGWVLADEELTRKMLRLNDLFGVNNPYVTDQISCLAFAKLPQIAKWSRELLAHNTALANEFLASTPQMIAEPLRVGTVMFPRVDFDVDVFCRLLRENYDTVVTPGAFFGAPNYLRIGVGGDPTIYSEGLNRLHEAASEFSSS